ncbi:MAG: hypothetical protein M1587_03935 [Thaumarchaeota archaeon]|nr:hypothetical protein [Nitrososphaerota archaeon]
MRAEGELWDAASAFTEYRGHDKGLTKGAGKLAKKTNDLRLENFKKQEKINKRIDKLEA